VKQTNFFSTNVQGDFKSPSKQKGETRFSYINGIIQHMFQVLEKKHNLRKTKIN